jgi:hypothetical protein
VDDDRMSGEPVPEPAGIDLDASPFETPPVAGIPFGKDSEEARAIERILARYAAARAKVGPREVGYTDDSPFGIPPIG